MKRLLAAAALMVAGVAGASAQATPPTQSKTTPPATQTKQPTTPAATQSKQPATPAATQSKQPTAPAATQTKQPAPQTKQPAPPVTQSKTTTPPVTQSKTTAPVTQAKTTPPVTQAKTTPPATPPATQAAHHTTQPAPPAGRGAAPVTTETPPVDPMVMMREVYEYDRDGRRDPFISLLSTTDLRPTLSDLKLLMTVVDEPGRSVALVADGYDRKQKTLRVGTRLGRMRVSSIRTDVVVFTIEEFGTNRRDSLMLRDPSKVRGR